MKKKKIAPNTHAHRDPVGVFMLPWGQTVDLVRKSSGSSLSFVFSSPQHRWKWWIIIRHHACAFTAEQTHEYANTRPLSFSRGRTTQSARIAPPLTPSQHSTNILHRAEPLGTARSVQWNPCSPVNPRALLKHELMWICSTRARHFKWWEFCTGQTTLICCWRTPILCKTIHIRPHCDRFCLQTTGVCVWLLFTWGGWGNMNM